MIRRFSFDGRERESEEKNSPSPIDMANNATLPENRDVRFTGKAHSF